MANLTITTANVADGTGANISSGRAGAALTAGMAVYADSTTTPANELKGGDADLSLAAATIVGITLAGAATGQKIFYQTSGPITIGATLVVGTEYYLSATGGGLLCPAADLASTWWVQRLGIAISTTVLQLELGQTLVQKP